MTFLSHCLLLYTVLLLFFAPIEEGNPQVVLKNLMVGHGLQWEASLSSLAQSGAESTVPGWEACPQLRRGGALPPQEAYFTHVLVKWQRRRGAGWCARGAGSSWHPTPLPCASELGFRPGSPSGFAPGLPQVGALGESFGVSVFVCVHMCLCVRNTSALYPRQSIRQNTASSVENSVSSWKFSSWFTKPMWEFTDSSHLKFGQWS